MYYFPSHLYVRGTCGLALLTQETRAADELGKQVRFCGRSCLGKDEYVRTGVEIVVFIQLKSRMTLLLTFVQPHCSYAPSCCADKSCRWGWRKGCHGLQTNSFNKGLSLDRFCCLYCAPSSLSSVLLHLIWLLQRNNCYLWCSSNFYFTTQLSAPSADPQAQPKGSLLWSGRGCFQYHQVRSLAVGDLCRRCAPRGRWRTLRDRLPTSKRQKVAGWGLRTTADQGLCPFPAALVKKILVVLF